MKDLRKRGLKYRKRSARFTKSPKKVTSKRSPIAIIILLILGGFFLFQERFVVGGIVLLLAILLLYQK